VDLTFARTLRSILRQDPDIILVGELRDQETANIAIRAAMTGHLVLSTLHTNDAISSTMRLIDMGVESFLAAAVLRGIMAQRLVRRNCQKCVRKAELNLQEKIWLQAVLGPNADFTQFKQGTGCNYCNNTGYKGQIGVYELLEWTPQMAEALRSNDPKKVAAMATEQEAFRPLVLSGLDLAMEGVTSVNEVMRISDLGYHDLKELVVPNLDKSDQPSQDND
jgi:MSHA biogenesis protein MshE